MITINVNELDNLSIDLKSNLELYNRIGKPIVIEYTKDLDDKVAGIKTYLDNIRQYNLDMDVPSLQRMCIDLSSIIYYTSANLEKVGLLEDMASIKFKDKYNDAYTSKQEATTIDKRKWTSEQLRATAEQEAISEKLIHFIYTHAASEIKSKIECANDLLKVLSKSLSAEIQSMSTYGASNKYHN